MPYSGTLITRVFTGRGQIPVRNAVVSVVQHRADGDHLLDLQTSDRSGNTAPITIETPSPQNSQTPNQPPPFSLCDIWAEHSGYRLLLIRDVQIFPGITSVQELPLIPLSEKGLSMETVTIPPQDL